MVGFVIPETDIVRLIINVDTGNPISPVTLRKHFKDELARGFLKTRVRHHMALFKAVEAGNVTAQIWWDKTRHRISERPEPPPPPAPGTYDEDLEKLSILDAGRRVAFALVLAGEAGEVAPEPAQPREPSAPKKKRTRQPA